MKSRLIVLICILFSLPLYAQTNVKPEFEDDISLKKINTTQSIVFDNYEEVFIKNFDEEKITEFHILGNVKIRFQNNTLVARKVIVTAKGDQVLEISAYEDVEFHYGSDIYLCTSLIFEPSKQRGVLKNVRSYMGSGANIGPMSSASGWYYNAQSVTILDQDRVVLEKVVFTTSEKLVPHYSFYAGKLWFFKNQVVYALHLTYTVGQSDFLYFPFFLRWEKGTGIRTAFAQEKRIGWYMMNSFDYSAPYGRYNMGLDLYERLGEYAFVKFNTSKAISNISRIQAEVEVADDVRLFNDPLGDRYTQLQDVYGTGQFTSIRQFSWRYKFNMDFKASDMNVNVFWEDMNDPNFSSKYNQSRQDTFDVKKLLQPDDNTFYLRNDSSFLSTGQTLSRGFSINAGKFRLNGAWIYKRQVASETNQYLNSRYKYMLYQRSLPNLSYTPTAITLLKSVQSKVPQSYSIALSNTNIILKNDRELQDYLLGLNGKTVKGSVITNIKISMTNQKAATVKDTGKNSISNMVTNRVISTNAPLLPRIVTNYYVFYDLNSSVNASLNFTGSETLNTNGDVTSDRFNHTESGSLSFNGAYFNRLVSWNNALSFVNRKDWTSLGTNVNDTATSGYDMSLTSSLAMNKTLIAWNEKAWQLSVPLSLSHSMVYQLVKTISATRPREITHNTGLSTGLNMFKQQINWTLGLAHNLKYRITNDVIDNYLDNKLDQRLTANTGLKLWWLSASTSMSLNLLETRSNALELDYQDFTNRLSGNPRLTLGLAVPNNYLTASYVYDLIDATNVSLGLASRFAIQNLHVPLIYEMTALSLGANLSYDFLQKTSSLFTLSFSMNLRLTKYWKLNFNTSVRNTQIYRYFVKDISELPFGVTPLNFWTDLGDSLKIWDYEALKRGNFKVQGLHFNLEHDLDEWLLSIQFNINRRIDSIRMFAYWEPSIRVEFKLNGSSDQFPPYKQKFVPEEYQ